MIIITKFDFGNKDTNKRIIPPKSLKLNLFC